MTIKVKLTSAQRELLLVICQRGRQRLYTGYKPAVNLVRFGLAEWERSHMYASWLHPTDAGRAHYLAHIAGDAAGAPGGVIDARKGSGRYPTAQGTAGAVSGAKISEGE